jgi:Fe-S-cluster containining protein
MIIESHASKDMLAMLSRHRCEGCGACCRWNGHVFLYRNDVKRIADRVELTIPDFLKRYCVVVRWRAGDVDQYRLGLARHPGNSGCIFLENSRCSIHAFKPLMCKAGPAGWPWLADPESFWMYARKSPSFNHREGTLSRGSANYWFTRTRRAAAIVQEATSLKMLARIHDVSFSAIRNLPLLGFEQGGHSDVSVSEP